MATPLQIAREMIAQQDFTFKVKLVKAIDEMMKHTSSQAMMASDELHAVEKLIFDRTGCLVKLMVDEDSEIQMLPTFLNNCSILRFAGLLGEDFDPTLWKAITGGRGHFQGSVDFKNAKLTGDYTKIETPILVGYNKLTQMGGSASIGGMLMHEVGHVWTVFATSWRSNLACMFLAQISNTMLKQPERITHVIADVTDKMQREGLIGSKTDLDGLTEVKSPEVMATMVLGAVWQKTKSDLGSRVASMHQNESLADTFATRFGFGKELMDALFAVGGGQAPTVARNAVVQYFGGTIVSAVQMAISATAVGIGVGTGAGIATGLLSLGAWLFLAGHPREDTKIPGVEQIYGTERDRVTRIRLNLVDALKDPTLNTDVRRELLKQEKALAVCEKAMPPNTTLIKDIANLLTPGRRKTAAAIHLERELEKLAANDLFVSAARLREVV